MATPAHDKYYLRSLHQEIDLFDRKLAHSATFEVFKTEAERTAAADKLRAKRELLARTARQLVEDGIEFKPSELPRSFRTAEMRQEIRPEPAIEEPAVSLMPKASLGRSAPSHFAGTMLDGQAQLEAYKRARVKPPQA